MPSLVQAVAILVQAALLDVQYWPAPESVAPVPVAVHTRKILVGAWSMELGGRAHAFSRTMCTAKLGVCEGRSEQKC